MNVVFSAVKKNELLDKLIGLGATWFLFSFEDKKVDKYVAHLNQYADTHKLTILIDSGAFSAWNRGAKIDLNHYAKFIDHTKTISKNRIYHINLDVIPHTKGQGKPTPSQTIAACEKGLENYRFLKERGHFTVHTMHQHDPWEYLDIILKEANDLNYIGISPANEEDLTSKNAWLDKVFYKLRGDVKTHILGLTAIDSLERYPCYTADSSAWLNVSKFGELFNYDKLQKDPKVNLNRYNAFYLDDKSTFDCAFKYYLALEKHLTNLWTKRKIVWQN